jgi:hypothetical protein
VVVAQQNASTHLSELNTTCCTKSNPCVGCCVYGADVGPKTIELFESALKECRYTLPPSAIFS